MANEFSDASAVVAKATGATGDALDGLNKSMMNVYSNAKTDDLSSVAGAIGEINTRLGLTGPELDHVTSLFMDYSQITGSEVVGAVQNVTKVMKNWGVEVSDTESLLDKLSAAGQMSGISVDQLSNLIVQNKATLQQLGYGLDESIALLSMFEYEGLNSSSIMMGFRSAVTGFTNDGKDASVAMQEVIEQIANMASESDATALAVETFGSRAGAELAFAIRNGKFEIQDWISAVSSADGTLSQTADAATTLEEKWQKASNSISLYRVFVGRYPGRRRRFFRICGNRRKDRRLFAGTPCAYYRLKRSCRRFGSRYDCNRRPACGIRNQNGASPHFDGRGYCFRRRVKCGNLAYYPYRRRHCRPRCDRRRFIQLA